MRDFEMNVTETKPMTIKKTRVPKEPTDAAELREIYRNLAYTYSRRLHYSVIKNYDPPISHEGYQEEIELQKDLARQVFYLQDCRAAIELALQEGTAVVEGRRVTTTFTKQGDGKILVTENEK